MLKFDNIVIISDVDGTFLGSESRIVQRNIDAVKYFTANGGKFTFASGRNPVELADLIPIYAELANIPVGYCNGMYVQKVGADTPDFEALLDTDALCDALDYILNNRNGLEVLLVRGSEFYGFEKKDLNFVAKYEDHLHYITPDRVKNMSVGKLVFFGEPQKLNIAVEHIMARHSDVFDSVQSLEIAREFIPKGCGKNIIVTELRRILGPSHKFFAIGDYGNDFALLKNADVAACPANALDEIKKICDIHVCSNNDGAIADLIQTIEEKYLG